MKRNVQDWTWGSVDAEKCVANPDSVPLAENDTDTVLNIIKLKNYQLANLLIRLKVNEFIKHL